MMDDIVFKPIDAWPHKAGARRSSPFKSSYGATMTALRAELRQLKARNIVIQLDMADKDIRLDGLPRADANPKTPRVILAFESAHGPLKYFVDTYPRWTDNLRAIALGLECLRAVDRYGITRRGEQYTGWKQLPGAIAIAPTMTREEAAIIIANWGEYTGIQILGDPAVCKAAYRQAVLRTHPDQGGRAEDFRLVQEAYEWLEKAGA